MPAAATELEEARPDFRISSPRCPGSCGSVLPSPGSCLVDRADQETDLGRGRSAVGVLVTLCTAGKPLRIGEIADRMRAVGSHITRQVQTLEKRGFRPQYPRSA
ncbi:hypothetical protein [Streptomyces angustmyceticus]|uniref:hypothetical protein n=1 Tax=Streptomyces angustmyceticus TaxID=285578 RepID=UPI0038042DB4